MGVYVVEDGDGVVTDEKYPTPHQTRGGIPLMQDCKGKTTPSATRGRRGCIVYACSTTTYPNAKACGYECPLRIVFRSDTPPRLGAGQGGDGELLWYLDHGASRFDHGQMCAFLFATHKAESGREGKRPVGGRHNKTAIVRVCGPALSVLLVCLLDPSFVTMLASTHDEHTHTHTLT